MVSFGVDCPKQHEEMQKAKGHFFKNFNPSSSKQFWKTTFPNVSIWPNHHFQADMRNLTLVIALKISYALKRRCMRCCYP